MSRTKNTGRRLAAILLTMLLAVSTVTMNLTIARATTLSNPRTDSSGVVTWDCVYFGNYPQSDATGQTKEPIKWRVLSVNGNDAFLVADQNLDCQRYNTTYTSTTWETCTMRSWLNGYGSSSNTNGVDYSTDNFIDRAFTSSEQNAILTTTLENADNPTYGTEGGNNTDDKVFLLSYDDVTNTEYGFSVVYIDDDNARKRKNTAYVAAGGTIDSSYMISEGSNDYWWLRSPGSSGYAMFVDYGGYVNLIGYNVGSSRYSAVCPALHLNLSSSNLWSYAGTVSSDGNSTGGENPPSGGEETPDGDSSGFSCKQTITVEAGQTGNIDARVYAQSEATMKSLSSGIKWSSSDESVVTVNNGGFIQATAPTSYVSDSGSYSLWWASGMVSVIGKKAGSATVTGKLTDGTTVNCQVTVQAKVDDSGSTGSGGALVIGEEAEGTADSDSGVAQFFPASWSLKSSKYPVELKQEEKTDGTYTIKGSIGIGRSNLLDKETEWCKYKKACEAANEDSSEYDTLESYKDIFGLKSSTAIQSSGWEGEKPSLSMMGYVEITYDKNGHIISSSGCIAGGLECKGGMNWKFATPIGPMYLNFEMGGKLTLSGGPSWNNDEKKMSLDGKVTITPSVSLTGGYGMEKVASVSAKGEASLGVQAYPASKGTFTAEASVNAHVIFVFDQTWTLAKYEKTLWNTIPSEEEKTVTSNAITKSSLQMMSTDFAEEATRWSGKVAAQSESQLKILQEGILSSSLPMLAAVDGKQVLVWQAYDETREVANSTVLKYSVYENGSWSQPEAVKDDGYGDAFADLQVIDGKLYLTWQKHMADITTTDEDAAINQMAENAEIFCAEFDSGNNSFTNIKQITDNDACDMMPQFVKGTSSVEIAYIRNDADSMMQDAGNNAVYSVSLDDVSTEKLLCQSPGTIDRYTAYAQDGTSKVMYVTQANDIIAVMNSDNEPIEAWNELMRLSEDGSITALHYEDGNICAISNGTLYSYNLKTQEMSQYTAGNSAFDSNAVYCTNGTKSGYVWSSYDEDNNTGYIKASMKTEEGYSQPVTLFETEGEITRYMAPVLTEDGEWNIALNQEICDSEIHNLSYLCKEESVNSQLISASINEEEQDGKTGIDYVFVNNGDSYIDTVTIKITDSDGNVVQQNVSVQIEPGETVADTVYVDLSDLEIGQEVSISMCDSSQSAANENTIETEYAKTDIALVGTATQDAAGIQVKVVAKNQGENDADIDVSLYSDSNMQNLLSEEKSVKVTGGKQKEVSFTVDPKDISYNENRAAYLTVQANVTGGDYDISNNVVYLALYEGEEVNANTAPKETTVNPDPNPSKDDNPQKENPAGNSGNPLNSQKTQTQQTNGINSQTTGKQMTALKLSGISKKIAAGKKIKLSPAITPIDATDQTLTWTSSNPKYATVSQQGVVTTKKKGAGKSVTITATARDGSGITASYKIRIVKDAVKSIKLKAVSKSVKAGKKITLKATVKTSGKTANKTLQWSSSNIKYATVSKKGVVTTKKAGKGKTVKITAMATDGTGKKAAITFKIR